MTYSLPAAHAAAAAYVAAHPHECLPSGLVAAMRPHLPGYRGRAASAVLMAAACGAVRHDDHTAVGWDTQAFEGALSAGSIILWP